MQFDNFIPLRCLEALSAMPPGTPDSIQCWPTESQDDNGIFTWYGEVCSKRKICIDMLISPKALANVMYELIISVENYLTLYFTTYLSWPDWLYFFIFFNFKNILTRLTTMLPGMFLLSL